MFTGIITRTGTVAGKTRNTLTVRAERDIVRKLKKGDSIAVNGACLTVTKKTADSFSADIMPETLKRTNFSSLTATCVVNLELPLTAASFISGHFVQGHVDGVAKIKKIEEKSDSHIISLEVPTEISRYLVEKGSVAVNGISLSIIKAGKNAFSVGVIPHSWKSTNLHLLKKGDEVNAEVDILAKYAKKLLSNSRE